MTRFALNRFNYVNGVAKRHMEISAQLLSRLQDTLCDQMGLFLHLDRPLLPEYLQPIYTRMGQ
jgi:hypothetical protein